MDYDCVASDYVNKFVQSEWPTFALCKSPVIELWQKNTDFGRKFMHFDFIPKHRWFRNANFRWIRTKREEKNLEKNRSFGEIRNCRKSPFDSIVNSKCRVRRVAHVIEWHPSNLVLFAHWHCLMCIQRPALRSNFKISLTYCFDATRALLTGFISWGLSFASVSHSNMAFTVAEWSFALKVFANQYLPSSKRDETISRQAQSDQNVPLILTIFSHLKGFPSQPPCAQTLLFQISLWSNNSLLMKRAIKSTNRFIHPQMTTGTGLFLVECGWDRWWICKMMRIWWGPGWNYWIFFRQNEGHPRCVIIISRRR